MDLEQRRFGWRRADPAWLGLVLVVLVLAGLRGGWALDDRELVLENPLVRGELPWWRAFDRDYFHHLGGAGQWRPLATLSLRLDHALYGATSTGYHVTNALLQLAVAALLLPWLHGAARARAAVLAGSCAFALHPALCDAFGWIAGRTSMLSALGPLAAAAWLARRERAPAPAALCVAGRRPPVRAARQGGRARARAARLVERAGRGGARRAWVSRRPRSAPSSVAGARWAGRSSARPRPRWSARRCSSACRSGARR
ncbi:MAG: hypothetical protein H6828_08595 [Planctomycetes bacterium]|nr:hypothetical protein [Planctomycetota bacterium]